MVIVDRYIFKGFIGTFLFTACALWALYILGDVFGFLDEILKAGIPASSLVSFYFYLTPFILSQTIPVSTLIACVYLLGNLNKNNEITALRASGVSIWRILSPMLTTAFIISICVFAVNDRVLPKSMRMANRIRYEKLDVGKRGKLQTITIKDVAIYGEGNRLIFARKFDIQKNILEDVIIHQHDVRHGLILKISARKIAWINKAWYGEDVVIYRMNNMGQFIGEPTLKENMKIPITETPANFVNNQWKPEFMSYAQLKKYISVFATGSRRTYKRLLVDLNHKLSFPFTCVVTIIISASFAISTKRGGAMIGMAKGIVVALLYIPVMAVGLALGKGGWLPPVLAAWFSNIIFTSLGVYLLSKY